MLRLGLFATHLTMQLPKHIALKHLHTIGTCPPVTMLGTKPATESDTSLAVATRELNATEFGDLVNERYWNRTSHVS